MVEPRSAILMQRSTPLGGVSVVVLAYGHLLLPGSAHRHACGGTPKLCDLRGTGLPTSAPSPAGSLDRAACSGAQRRRRPGAHSGQSGTDQEQRVMRPVRLSIWRDPFEPGLLRGSGRRATASLMTMPRRRRHGWDRQPCVPSTSTASALSPWAQSCGQSRSWCSCCSVTTFDAEGVGWWLWTCLAGVGLGLPGLEYTRKRRDAIARARLGEEADREDEPVLAEPEAGCRARTNAHGAGAGACRA